jgi:glycine/D-amino acid oxidase-like deaminating enzyme
LRSTADIVVIGAGIIGVSTAHHLASKGAKDVLVLDRGAAGRGQTQKSGGFVQTHWSSLSEVRAIAKSREVFRHWGEIIGGDCGWSETGYLHVTGPEKEPGVRRVHQMLLDEGLESHWIDRDGLRELQPSLHIDDLSGGAWEPTSGCADPMKTVLSLAEAAKRKGAEIREGVAVLQIAHRSGKITGVETSEGFISTRTVILAIGPWIHTLHPNPQLPLPIRAMRGQVIYSDRTLPRGLAFYDEVLGLYTHPDGDANLVGLDWSFDPVWSADDYRREADDKYIETCLRALAYRFPPLTGSKLLRGVVGLYDFTPDGYPIIDAAGIEGYYVAAGFSGTGFKSAPMTGLGLAELVLDGSASSIDLGYCKLARFTA